MIWQPVRDQGWCLPPFSAVDSCREATTSALARNDEGRWWAVLDCFFGGLIWAVEQTIRFHLSWDPYGSN